MENQIKARYRNKLDKIIIEVWNGEKWLYVKTLKNPLIDFSMECLEKVSCNTPILEQKEPQKFGQSILSEPSKQDILQVLKKFDDEIYTKTKKDLPDE